MMTACTTPASQKRSYQSVIQSPAPNSARNAMQPRQAHINGRGQRLARVSSLVSHAIIAIVALFALMAPSVARAQGTLIPFVPQQFYDSNGDPCSGCKLYTYAAGTSTPQATYSDVTLTTANANPVVINAAGRPTTGYIFLSATSYKFEFQSAASVVLWTVDNATAIPTTAGNTDITVTAGEALSAGDLAYLSDGSGSLTAGRWYKADADLYYGSIHPALAFVPTAIASGATGSVRLAGTVTNLSGLTAGSTYYVSGTAAGVTATAPANARRVGQALTTTSLAIDFGPAWLMDAGEALGVAEGRLTLTTATPVTTADVTGATSIFYTPYIGNRIALFDGTRWKGYAFSELTFALGTLSSGLPYDLYLYDNAGTLTLEATAWTNTTTRATALVRQNGVYVKTGATTRRYLGTFHTTATTTTEDSFAKRFLWNYYNRVPRAMRVIEETDSWSYTTATWRQANGAVTNQLAVVVGVAEVPVFVQVTAMANNDNAGVQVRSAIGEDSTSAPSANGPHPRITVPGVGYFVPLISTLYTFPAVGYHFYAWLEYSAAGVGTTSFFGDSGGTDNETGIVGVIEG